MSSKTKIVVLHLKELIYTGIFVVLGILFIVLLVVMFLPDKKDNSNTTTPSTTSPETEPMEDSDTPPGAVTPDTTYIPGVYTTTLTLNDHSVDVEVVVDQSYINSIRLVNLEEAVTTMFPLLQPSFDSLTGQILETQSLEGITYAEDSKYTSMILLQAIQSSLNKAMVTDDAETAK